MAQKQTPSKGPLPFEIIFSCQVCFTSISDIYQDVESDLGFRGSNDISKEQSVTKLWLSACSHLFCSAHIEGGGVPFYKAGERPKAPCPICSKEKNDKDAKVLYGIRGCLEGMYDQDIPEDYFNTPPFKLEDRSKNMGGTIFQYLALVRFATNVLAKYEKSKVSATAAHRQAKALKEDHDRLLEQCESQKQRLSQLQKCERELQSWKQRENKIMYYLGVFKEVVSENTQIRNQLIALGHQPPSRAQPFQLRYDTSVPKPPLRDQEMLQNEKQSFPTLTVPFEGQNIHEEKDRQVSNTTSSRTISGHVASLESPHVNLNMNEADASQHRAKRPPDQEYADAPAYVRKTAHADRPHSRFLMPPPALPANRGRHLDEQQSVNEIEDRCKYDSAIKSRMSAGAAFLEQPLQRFGASSNLRSEEQGQKEILPSQSQRLSELYAPQEHMDIPMASNGYESNKFQRQASEMMTYENSYRQYAHDPTALQFPSQEPCFYPCNTGISTDHGIRHYHQDSGDRVDTNRASFIHYDPQNDSNGVASFVTRQIPVYSERYETTDNDVSRHDLEAFHPHNRLTATNHFGVQTPQQGYHEQMTPLRHRLSQNSPLRRESVTSPFFVPGTVSQRQGRITLPSKPIQTESRNSVRKMPSEANLDDPRSSNMSDALRQFSHQPRVYLDRQPRTSVTTQREPLMHPTTVQNVRDPLQGSQLTPRAGVTSSYFDFHNQTQNQPYFTTPSKNAFEEQGSIYRQPSQFRLSGRSPTKELRYPQNLQQHMRTTQNTPSKLPKGNRNNIDDLHLGDFLARLSGVARRDNMNRSGGHRVAARR